MWIGDHGRFYDDLLRRVAAMPGVGSAGLMSTVPIHGSLPNGRMELDGDMDKQAIGAYVVASAGAFDADAPRTLRPASAVDDGPLARIERADGEPAFHGNRIGRVEQLPEIIDGYRIHVPVRFR